MTGTPDALALVRSACDTAGDLVAGSPLDHTVAVVRARLDGPLRVAIAGRTKAGKSTLLNALIGERLAATDAGECTRIVTSYREAIGYEVQAVMSSGQRRELGYTSEGGRLVIDLDGIIPDEIEQLHVGWPSSALRSMTLIDTPGLASINERVSARTERFLALDDDGVADADAVIYLMRHLHRRDVDFLEAFADHSVPHASPANAVAVLSRADEIGVARLDAMASAARIAERHRSGGQLRQLCATVLPVAGLVAETGLTLQESEFAALCELAAMEAPQLEAMLLSADRFRAPDAASLSPAVRHELALRFGMFGLRYSIVALRARRVTNASELARALVAVSGLPELQRLIGEHFGARARLLKARSALRSLREIGRELTRLDAGRGSRLEAEIERLEAAAPELAQLRLSYLVASGEAVLHDAEAMEIGRLLGAGSLAERIGCDPDAGDDAVAAVLVAAVERWRRKSAHPRIDVPTREACDIAARSYEVLHAQLRAGRATPAI